MNGMGSNGRGNAHRKSELGRRVKQLRKRQRKEECRQLRQ